MQYIRIWSEEKDKNINVLTDLWLQQGWGGAAAPAKSFDIPNFQVNISNIIDKN